MQRYFFSLPALLVALSLAIGSPASAAEPSPGSRDTRLAEALKVYAKRDSLKSHRAAMRAFSKLAADFPKDKELQLWCARTAIYLSHRENKIDPKPGHRVAMQGNECAKRMLKIDKSDYDGRFTWLMTQFRAKQSEGVADALKIAKKIRPLIERMVKDAPDRYEGWMMLGTVLVNLPGPPISFGDPAKGIAYLEKADELKPLDAEVLLELAGGYAKVGRKDDARRTYRKCIDEVKPVSPLKWETEDAQDWAKKMLDELG